ncbi:MAG TPA: hypothetical protein VMS08_01540 [Candidatus Saccharimonadia bacterium]|nr:hypothetical protein [Candidatus Saccharimonadia bacterium]
MKSKSLVCQSDHICLCLVPCPGYSEHKPGTLSKANETIERALETADWTYVRMALMHVDDCPHFASQLRREVL